MLNSFSQQFTPVEVKKIFKNISASIWRTVKKIEAQAKKGFSYKKKDA